MFQKLKVNYLTVVYVTVNVNGNQQKKRMKALHVINATAGIIINVLNLKEQNLFFKSKIQPGIAVDAVERERAEEKAKVLPRSKKM